MLAGAAPARLHLVADPQDAVLAQLLGERAEQPVGPVGEPADPLDRLGDQRRDVAAHLVEDLAQIPDARVDELGVRQARERAAEAVAPVHVVGLERRERGR